MSGTIIRFPERAPPRLSLGQGRPEASRILATPISERVEKGGELALEDPAVLLCVTGILDTRLETSPRTVLEESEFFYNFLEKPPRKIGLFDEREYYLGEFALMAGTACRLLFRREEARVWFDRAESIFVLAVNGMAHVGRLAYQRMALGIEERRFEEVLGLVPRWSETFIRLELLEDALKCRFLEGIAYWEMGQADKAISVYREICSQAEAIRSVRLIAGAASNLVRYYAVTGRVEEALSYSRKALPMLKQLENRVALAKLQWSIGDLLRGQRKLGEAAGAYRSALEEAREVGMRGDVAALHLVLADVLLDAGQDRQAEWEVRAALPIIDEERMVPEGFAALGLLREALRYRQVDRQALRELHGFFRDREG